MTLEHDVNLAIGPTLHLRQPDECYDQAEKTSATPDISTLSAKVSTLIIKC